MDNVAGSSHVKVQRHVVQIVIGSAELELNTAVNIPDITDHETL
jgi:hypothetical protein